MRDVKVQEALPLDDLISKEDDEIVKVIKDIDILQTSPIDALNILYKLKSKVDSKIKS